MTLPLSSANEAPGTYRKTTLDNGLRIVTEEIPYLQSVSLGIWVRNGSRFETPQLNGISHFIEHMLFKGTRRRTAYDIAREIDSVGGGLNAFTSKELTSFYCRVMGEHLEVAADLLVDIFLNASLPEDEIEREKQVICQEIHQMEDSPEDLVHEMLGLQFWANDSLGQPILGTIPIITQLNRETLIGFKQAAYSPAETVVCAAGNVGHDRFVDLIEPHLGRIPRGQVLTEPAAPLVEASSQVVNRDLEQVHICLGTTGPSAVDPSRYAGYILNAILGGGMSSRLFQEVREKSALAYSVYSFLSSFSNTGLFWIYAGRDRDRAEELVAILRRDTSRLSASMTEEDIRTAKNQIKGNMILALESSETRMNRLAKGEFYFGRHIPLDEIVQALESVTAEDLSRTADQMMNPGHLTAIALGPVSKEDNLFRDFVG